MLQLLWGSKKRDFIKARCDSFGYKLQLIPEKSINPETTNNIYIEGDNLLALKLIKKDYLNKIKLIYIDPPYNTGKNFLYKDKFTKSKPGSEEYKLQENQTNDIHENWLSMIYKRLVIAHSLLKDDGLIFISIDENEQAYLKVILDEIFGRENYVNCFVWINNIAGRQATNKGAAKTYEYILCYAKNIENINIFEIDIQFAKQNMPVQLIKLFLKSITKQNDIILDFFAGSSTTAHAVMELNLEDNGNRQFIMIQNAEECHKKSQTYKSGFNTISEVGIERIKKAGKILKEQCNNLDIGFKYYKIKENNND